MSILSMYLLALVSCTQIWANDAHIKLLEEKPSVKRKVIARPKRDRKVALYEKIIEGNKEIKRLLSQKSSRPVIWDGTKKILTGKVFKGVLLNSIVSTNLASPVLVRVAPNQGLPDRTLFSCKGATKNRRVLTLCDRMITKNKEVRVVAQVLNLDGSSGLLGDFDDGKEELISGALLSEFFQGVASVAQNRINTPFGETPDSSVKNQLLGGLIRGGSTTSEILLEEMKTKEPIVTVNAGAEVLIYFMEALNDY